jgi:hypothetical protein
MWRERDDRRLVGAAVAGHVDLLEVICVFNDAQHHGARDERRLYDPKVGERAPIFQLRRPE